MKIENILNTVKVVVMALVLTIGIQMVAAQSWQPPTASPPSGNTYAPINVGSAGQTKDGGLTLNAVSPGAMYGLTIPFGKVSIGAGINTTEKVEVLGNIKGTDLIATGRFCLPGTAPTGGCLSAWPTAGTAGAGLTCPGCSNNRVLKFIDGTTDVMGNSSLTDNGASGSIAWDTLVMGGTLGTMRTTLTSAANYIQSAPASPTTGNWRKLVFAPYGSATAIVAVSADNGGTNARLGVGTANPAAALDVVGTAEVDAIKVTGGSPATGRVLTATDSSGNANWQQPDKIRFDKWVEFTWNPNIYTSGQMHECNDGWIMTGHADNMIRCVRVDRAGASFANPAVSCPLGAGFQPRCSQSSASSDPYGL